MVAVGIDLGTTYSVVALADASLTNSRVIPNREGKKLTPSAVFFDGEQPVVGAAAVAAGALAPGDYVELVKRQIGDPSWRFETTGGTSYSAEEISALIVRQVVEDAEHELDQPCSEAVITVPAYFDDARRRATSDAGIIAGVDVLRIINEPTAAALAYGFGAAAPEHGGTFESTLLVYDWGGGTFDATVVGIYGDDYTVLATAGDRNLGGFDLDNALMLYVDEAIVAQGGVTSLDGDIAELALREHCEQAKRALSALPETVVAIPVGGTTYRVEITQPTFADLTRPLLRRTEEIVAEVMEDADTPYGGLTAALLVGGSTRAPMVSRMLSRVTGASVRGDVRPDEAVALGAAIAAADASAARRGEENSGTRHHAPRRLHISDVTAHSLGLLARDGATGREINSVVVKRNEPLPAVGKKRFHTLAENQREILVVITEGEDTDPAYVTVVGSARIPVPESQDSVEIEVAIGYDNQGMIEVTVTDVGGGVALGEFSIDRLANADSDEVHRMRRSLTALSLRSS